MATAVVKLALAIVILLLVIPTLLAAALIAAVIVASVVIAPVVVVGTAAARIVGIVDGLLNITNSVVNNIGMGQLAAQRQRAKTERLRNVSSWPVSSGYWWYLNQPYLPRVAEESQIRAIAARNACASCVRVKGLRSRSTSGNTGLCAGRKLAANQ